MISLVSTADTPMPPQGADCAAIAKPLVNILRELRAVLAGMTSEQYVSEGGELFAHATIGGHVRHCLDHTRAIAECWERGTVDYDHRLRGTTIETELAAADAELGLLIEAIEGLGKQDANARVCVSVTPTRAGQSVMLSSTLGRELAFVLSHTIHHNAMIRGIAQSLGGGGAVPASFGFAPSTLAHQDAGGSTRCAR